MVMMEQSCYACASEMGDLYMCRFTFLILIITRLCETCVIFVNCLLFDNGVDDFDVCLGICVCV